MERLVRPLLHCCLCGRDDLRRASLARVRFPVAQPTANGRQRALGGWGVGGGPERPFQCGVFFYVPCFQPPPPPPPHTHTHSPPPLSLSLSLRNFKKRKRNRSHHRTLVNSLVEGGWGGGRGVSYMSLFPYELRVMLITTRKKGDKITFEMPTYFQRKPNCQ